ncbi:Collagen alpha-1(XXVII) chain, partial [Frankliniella fusca]
ESWCKSNRATNQVAAAFGERQKPTSQQALTVKKLTESKKAAQKAHLDAQADVDRDALLSDNEMGDSDAAITTPIPISGKVWNKSSRQSGSRAFPKRSETSDTSAIVVQSEDIPKSNKSKSRQGRPGAPQTSRASRASESRNASESQPAGSSRASGPVSIQERKEENMENRDNSHVSKQLFTEESEEEHEDSESDNGIDFSEHDDEEHSGKEDVSSCCQHCLSLRKAYSKSGSLFVQALNVFGRVSSGSGIQYAELLPIPAGTKKCELSQKSNVFISIADKNEIKADGEGDPSKMTRMCLVALYGREFLEKNAVTAKGTKAGTLGIPSRVRKAIKAFVNRNKGKTYDPLNDAQLNRVINRKKNQVHRTKQTGSKSKKSPKATKSSSPKSSTVSHSPNKASSLSPTKKSPRGNPMSLQAKPSPNKPQVIASPHKQQWSVAETLPPNQETNSYSQQFQSNAYFSSDCNRWAGYSSSTYFDPSQNWNYDHQQQQQQPQQLFSL